jgi:hypothetical protein
MLTAALVLTPVGNAAGQAARQAIGVVVESSRASIGTAAVIPGTTVFSGDLLTTAPASALAVQLASFRILLLENSAVSVHRHGQVINVELERGTLVFSSAGPSQAMVLWVSDVQIHPQSADGFAGEVRVVSPCHLQVTSWRGPLQILNGKKTSEIQAQTVRLFPEHSISDRGSTRPAPQDAGYHQSHTHQNCPVPAAAPADPTLPVAFATTGVVTALLLRFLGSSSPFKP